MKEGYVQTNDFSLHLNAIYYGILRDLITEINKFCSLNFCYVLVQTSEGRRTFTLKTAENFEQIEECIQNETVKAVNKVDFISELAVPEFINFSKLKTYFEDYVYKHNNNVKALIEIYKKEYNDDNI